MDGLLLVNKEKGMTSRDVVNEICHIFNTKKVGHTGTLDPMATGVLVIAINKGLKVVDEITAFDKEYEAEITLGIETDTLDSTGKVLKEDNQLRINIEDIDRVLDSFIGDYDMEVPIYSAVKVNGKKLYEYARNNEEVELPVHKVKIYSLNRTSDLISENNLFKFKIRCKVSKGTYIRSLIRDISKKLGTIGIMSSLVRIKQGNFSIEDCYTLDDIRDGKYSLIPIKEVLDMPFIEVSDEIYKMVINGNKIENSFGYDKLCFTKDDKLIGIYEKDSKNSNILRPKKMF